MGFTEKRFNAFTSFARVDINYSIVDEMYRNPGHKLPETDFSTMNLSIMIFLRKTKY